MHRHLITLLAALTAAAITAGFAVASRHHQSTRSHRADDRGDRYTIGLWGDLPYSDQQKTVGVPNLIADMNSQHLAFTGASSFCKRHPPRSRRVAGRV